MGVLVLINKIGKSYTSQQTKLLLKLNAQEEITKNDLKTLGIFNDLYITKLLEAGQKNLREKLYEVLSRESIIDFS